MVRTKSKLILILFICVCLSRKTNLQNFHAGRISHATLLDMGMTHRYDLITIITYSWLLQATEGLPHPPTNSKSISHTMNSCQQVVGLCKHTNLLQRNQHMLNKHVAMCDTLRPLYPIELIYSLVLM